QLHAWGITGIDDAGRMQDLRMDSALAHDWMPGDPALLARQDPALELREIITRIAADLLYVPVAYDGGDNPEVDHGIWERYPGWFSGRVALGRRAIRAPAHRRQLEPAPLRGYHGRILAGRSSTDVPLRGHGGRSAWTRSGLR